MSQAARQQHAHRLPLNLEAVDLRACLEFRAPELRSVIDRLRADYNKQFQELELSVDNVVRNLRNPRAVHPDVARARLTHTKTQLHYLLQLHQLISSDNEGENTP